jgi:hypothetical protein
MQLASVCDISTGYTARGRLEPTESDGVLVIQLRDISADGDVAPERLTRVAVEGALERYLVRAGDVVFRSRGDRNTAFVLDERFIEPAVAVLPLMILRPKSQVVTPQYLAWAINQSPAQRYFDTIACGTNMRMLPKAGLEDLEIDVPDIETQRKIVEIHALAEREQRLAILSAEKRKTLTTLILNGQAKDLSVAVVPGRKKK